MGLEEHGKRREEEWVKEQEKLLIEEMKKKREERVRAQMNEESAKMREELKERHFMHCPKCGHDMAEIPLEGIKVDKCTMCEGIYFDRGELEDLMQKKTEDKKNIFRKLIGF